MTKIRNFDTKNDASPMVSKFQIWYYQRQNEMQLVVPWSRSLLYP